MGNASNYRYSWKANMQRLSYIVINIPQSLHLKELEYFGTGIQELRCKTEILFIKCNKQITNISSNNQPAVSMIISLTVTWSDSCILKQQYSYAFIIIFFSLQVWLLLRANYLQGQLEEEDEK